MKNSCALALARLLPLAALMVLLQGCASTGGSQAAADGIQITSDPSGATVMVDGVEIGATPVRIEPSKVFRAGFVGLSYRYYGKLVVKKAGCKDKVTEVNDAILAKDVHVALECDPGYRSAPAPAVTPQADPASRSPSPGRSDPYVERLERIETLHRKGLITEEEYRRLRKRIIGEL